MSRETVIHRIVERETQKRGLTEDAVRRDEPELHRTACKLFGAWETALRYAGINLCRLPAKQQYNRENVLRRIRVLCRTGYSLKAKDNKRREYGLYAAALQYFASWQQALRAAGIDLQRSGLFSTKPRRLKAPQILDQLRQWNAAGHSLDWAEICLENRVLANMAKIRFRSWRQALMAAGLSAESPARGRPPKWNPQRIIENIQRRQQAGQSLHHTDVQNDASGLLYAARDYFGTWANALLAAGCDSQARCGRQNGPSHAGQSTETNSIDTKST
jgi:hypothetical protein